MYTDRRATKHAMACTGVSGRPPPGPPPGFGEGAPPDNALHALDFEYTRITGDEVLGRLTVTETCCQPFKMLNGGVSALIAESWRRVDADRGVGEYRRVQEGGWRAAIHQPPQARPARRPRRGQGQPHAVTQPIQFSSSVSVWRALHLAPAPPLLLCVGVERAGSCHGGSAAGRARFFHFSHACRPQRRELQPAEFHSLSLPLHPRVGVGVPARRCERMCAHGCQCVRAS